MDSARLLKAGGCPLNRGKNNRRAPHRDFDYWLPNRGGRLMGGPLEGFDFSARTFCTVQKGSQSLFHTLPNGGTATHFIHQRLTCVRG